MAEIVTLELGMAVLAMIVLDLVLNPEPMLGLRRSGGLGGLLLGGLITLVARAGIGAALFWLAQRNATLFSLGEVQVSLTGIVFLAAGGLLLFRVLSEIIQLSAPRPARMRSDSQRTEAASGNLIAAAVLASVEPAAMGLGLAMSLESMVAGLVLGGVLVLVLARPMARLVNHFPHMRLLGLMALAVIGSGLVLTALGGTYPRPGMQGGVLVLALIAVGALIVLRQTGARPAFVVIPVDGDEDIAPEADATRPYVEPALDAEPVFEAAPEPFEEPAIQEPLPEILRPAPEPETFTIVQVEPEPRIRVKPAQLEVEPNFDPLPETALDVDVEPEIATSPVPAFEPESERETETAPTLEPESLPQTLALEPGDRPVPQSSAERARPPRRPLRRRRPSWRDSRRA